MNWVEFILQLGAVATALTGVGRLLIGVYKKYVTDPHDKRVAEIQKQSSQELRESISPLTVSIERLNYLLEEGKADRERLHEKDDELDSKLDSHEIRITVLETKAGQDKHKEK